jgi:putative tricarboxylic transport membrane protein
MDSLNLLAHGFSIALTPTNLCFVTIGVILGQIIGALPGIGPSLGMVLLLPISFGLQPVTAIVMLSGIMYGAMYGGTLTSVLINVPGESSSVMTTVEGYPLARQGRGGVALSVAAVGSFIAGISSVVALIFAAIAISNFALRFSPPEYFLLATLGILMSATLGGSPIKALAVAAFGLMIAFVGVDPIVGVNRLTFGSTELLDGIDFIPVAIGIFGITEVIISLENTKDLEPLRMRLRDMWPTWKDWMDCRMPIARGSVLGFVLGLLPGVGPTTATFIAYAAERRFSKHPEKFGKGALDALASCESANNSAVSGALVPLLTLGIPSSGMMAVLLAGFTLHNIRPGPMLMTDQPDLVWGLIASMFIGNVMLLILNLPLAPVFASLLRIPYAYLAPGILLLCLIGSYATTLQLFTVGITLVFGIVGYLMVKADLPRSPLVLALVLAPMMESSLRQSLILSHGSLDIFVTRPVSAVLLVAVVLVLTWPVALMFIRRRRAKGAVELPGE